MNEKNLLNLTKSWLFLGFFALSVAGVFAVILVTARTPFIQNIFAGINIFQTALIIHVDLSVLVWFLSIGAVFCSFIIKNQYHFLAKINFYVACLGTLLLVIAGFYKPEPLINNYVPVLQNLSFFLGLNLFLISIFIQSCLAIISFDRKSWSFFEYAYATLAITNLVGLFALALSMYQVKLANASYTSSQFYETVFWAPGHLLQFSYSQLGMIAWLKVTEQYTISRTKIRAICLSFLILNMLFALSGLTAFVMYDINSVEFYGFFTQHMIYFAGAMPLLVASITFISLFCAKDLFKNAALCSVLNSLILFAAGGIIGIMISGTNVTIPAHYHGSVVAITLAVAGYVYKIMPDIGFQKITGKLAISQSYLYGLGQLLHICALAYSGGYGVLRKDPSLLTNLKIKIAMGLMGLGGLLAIIGGLIFVVICLLSVKKQHNKA